MTIGTRYWKICAKRDRYTCGMAESYERRTLISNVATLLARRVISGAAASGLTTEHRHRHRETTLRWNNLLGSLDRAAVRFRVVT